MASFETSVVIRRPVDEVFQFITDTRNIPLWASAVESVTLDEPILGQGARGREVRTFLGRRMELDWEITDFEPNRKMGFRYTNGPFPAMAVFTLEAVAEGTRLTCRTNVEGRGIFRLMGPLLAIEGRNEDALNLQNLRRVLEEERSEAHVG